MDFTFLVESILEQTVASKYFESNEHAANPVVDRADIDTAYFTRQLINNLRLSNVFRHADKYIDFSKFQQNVETSEGIESSFTWMGFKGLYTVKVRKLDNEFIVIVECDDERLDSPESGTGAPWETYIKSVVDYIKAQEKQAEEAHENETERFKGEDVIQPTSDQASALPGAPAPAEPAPTATQPAA